MSSCNSIGIVVWFTGLSGSGKTTIAEMLKKELLERGKRVCVLDGDEVRASLHKHLGFSREDIRENNRLIAELAEEKKKSSDCVLVPIIAPFREDRAMARSIVGDHFLEVFVDCPLSVCEERDVKGLYQKVRTGEISDLIGVSGTSPYEKPLAPDLVIKTSEMSIEESTRTLLGLVLLRYQNL